MRIVGLVFVVVAFGCGDRKQDRVEAQPEDLSTPIAAPVTVDAARPPSQCNAELSTFCDGDDVVECSREGQRGKVVQTCTAGCTRGGCVETCAAKDVELVYVVDEARNFLSFDPRKLPGDPFHFIGTLDCASRGSAFSMAVDNHGVAWVLFDDGLVFRVSILDARCARTGYRLDGAPDGFGMGFATEKGGETLYIAERHGREELAIVDTSTAQPGYRVVAPLRAGQTLNPELSGTADGKLYGYFPQPTTGRPGFVTEIDRKTARPVGAKRSLPGSGEVGYYAFAHWGGTFFVFASHDGGNTKVHSIDRKTGAYKLAYGETAYRIVGAGVSTCAPLAERVP